MVIIFSRLEVLMLKGFSDLSCSQWPIKLFKAFFFFFFEVSSCQERNHLKTPVFIISQTLLFLCVCVCEFSCVCLTLSISSVVMLFSAKVCCRSIYWVQSSINFLLGLQKSLLGTVKRRKFTWFGHVTFLDSLTKIIFQDPLEGGPLHGRQRKWTAQPMPEVLTMASHRKD